MIIPDVNLLLYAVITGFPQHQRTRDWWSEALNADEPVGLTHPAVFGFLRIATSPRVLEEPLTLEEAGGYLDDWIKRPQVSVLVAGDDHLDRALDLLAGIGTAGNLTTDAQLAAYALESGGTIYSNDTDFARFPEVDWTNPLA